MFTNPIGIGGERGAERYMHYGLDVSNCWYISMYRIQTISPDPRSETKPRLAHSNRTCMEMFRRPVRASRYTRSGLALAFSEGTFQNSCKYTCVCTNKSRTKAVMETCCWWFVVLYHTYEMVCLLFGLTCWGFSYGSRQVQKDTFPRDTVRG